MMDTGIERLDQILEGGYPIPSSILVTGPPSIEKELIGLQFISEGLKKNDACFVISTTRTKKEITHILESLGVKEPEYLFIDSSGIGEGISSEMQLEGIIASVEDFLQKSHGKKIRGYLEVLSPALMTNTLSNVYEFNFKLQKLFKLYPVVSIFTLEEEMHEQKSVKAIEHLFDGMLEVRLLQEGNEILDLLKIKKMGGRIYPDKYHKFEVKVPEL